MGLLHFFFVIFLASSVFAAGKPSFSEVFPEFSTLNLSATMEKKDSKKFADLSYEQDRYYLSVQFGKVSQTQFDALKSFYGSRSQVAYQDTRSYDLSDFLPPSIQAVINQTFSPIFHNTDGLYSEKYEYLLDTDSGMDFWALRKNGLSTVTNCWNTTFENINAIVFGKNTYRLTVPSRWTAGDEVDAASKVIDRDDVQLWDMLVIREKSFVSEDSSMLMHTALFLNKNVVFEKTDSSENDPYRLSLVKDVLAKYKEIFGEHLIVEYRRATQPFLQTEVYMQDPIILELIKKLDASVNTDFISAGCETGMGGGCDMYLTTVVPTEIITYKKTGRGILKGPKNVLDRFSPL